MEQPHSQAGPSTASPSDGPRPLPFLQVLEKLNGGRLVDKLRMELESVVKEVMDRNDGKAGKVALTLTVEPPVKHRTGNQVNIIADVKVTTPSSPPEGYTFFFGPDGSLYTRELTQRDAFESA